MNIFLLVWDGRNLVLHLLQDNQYRWDWVLPSIVSRAGISEMKQILLEVT